METAKDWTDFFFLLLATVWIFTGVKLKFRERWMFGGVVLILLGARLLFLYLFVV
jgi:hypothetical protein